MSLAKKIEMKFFRLSGVLLCLVFTPLTFSQISHGGAPYFLQPSILRSSSGTFFIEMPAFNLDSVLKEDAINKENMRGSFQFAYKFYTHIDINDATPAILPDGTTVRQIGIHSAGAYSINLLLRDFDIPEGGKLFVYNSDHSYVAGSYDYRNDSPDKILPIQPVAGESIIVEYSEPANVPFKGHFVISEVNHDYRDIFRADGEPKPDSSGFSCMPDVLCSDASGETIRSTVLLIINGGTACTGSLLNNTSGDGKPYVLTGVHCFVDDENVAFPTDMNYYNTRAGTVVAFFNYARPVCDASINMKGSEEMSLAGATARAFVSRKDVALLEFTDSPPNYYNAYYAGWNTSLTGAGKHTNIHHPNFAVKKYGMTAGAISLVSIFPTLFDSGSFWKVPYWTIGSTYFGSSGSPLFDENNLVIGGLTGGNSGCTGTSPDGQADYFSVLGLSWTTADSINQLKTYLDPENTGVSQYQGMDPNQENPVIRLANADYTGGDSLITSKLTDNGYVFGTSSLSTMEFAEEFTVANPVEFFGAYFLLPPITFNSSSLPVTVYVYTGDSSPEIKIDSIRFLPQYTCYSADTFPQIDKTLNTAPTENFVKFNNPLKLTARKFYISYSIDPTATQFCVYNTKFQDASQSNTAWVKTATGWVTADAYNYFAPRKTSLAIQPLLRNWENFDLIETPPGSNNIEFFYERSGRILTLKEPLNTQGQAAVYSVSGQLLEKTPIASGQTTVVLREQPKGTIGVVRISSDYFSCVGEIIY